VTAVTKKVGKGTARQTIRVETEVWEDFGATADRLGSDRSALIREYILWAIRREGASPPRRPGPDEIAQ
jgi:hypothetical protein